MRRDEASELMMRFAERTGLTDKGTEQRYLWTDAFAVCNFLGLARATGQKQYLELALRTVYRVHHSLGRHRSDDRRIGWLSGLGEREGEAHPTRGGLRIGKELPERRPGEPFDDRLEWDRDGQYFHYLTQWMHALDQVARSTGDPVYNVWARELADTAFHAFTVTSPGGHGRMYWKMSIDLSRPLVASMGQHDPLDGYVTYLELSKTAAVLPSRVEAPALESEAREFEAIIAVRELTTTDPLGIGGLLIDAFRLDRLARAGTVRSSALLRRLLDAARLGLEASGMSHEVERPAETRLAFRELGLAIGLHAVALMQRRVGSDSSSERAEIAPRALLDALAGYLPLADAIDRFWLDPERQRATTWVEHLNINEVMLATSLSPEGFLGSYDE